MVEETRRLYYNPRQPMASLLLYPGLEYPLGHSSETLVLITSSHHPAPADDRGGRGALGSWNRDGAARRARAGPRPREQGEAVEGR